MRKVRALVFLVAAVPLLSCTGYGKPGLAGSPFSNADVSGAATTPQAKKAGMP